MVSNLEYYKVFYYVAKTGSVTQAAGILSISQPAVSQSIRQLEQQTKAKLFKRVSKGVQLTAEGELLYSYVAKGYEQFLLGEERLKQMQNLELGEIHIGASDMTLQFFLLPYLERFHEKYPGIKVIVSNAPTPETLHNLKKEQIDFGIVSSPLAEDPAIHAIPVRARTLQKRSSANSSLSRPLHTHPKAIRTNPLTITFRMMAAWLNPSACCFSSEKGKETPAMNRNSGKMVS